MSAQNVVKEDLIEKFEHRLPLLEDIASVGGLRDRYRHTSTDRNTWRHCFVQNQLPRLKSCETARPGGTVQTPSLSGFKTLPTRFRKA